MRKTWKNKVKRVKACRSFWDPLRSTLPDLLDLFAQLDQDESGYLTRDEIAGVPLQILPSKVLENVSVDSMEDLFEMLDVDGGNCLSQAEFLEGLLSLLLLDVPIWAIQLQKLIMRSRKHTTQIANDIKVLKGHVQNPLLAV